MELITPFIAMGFSFLSLLKTSYDLQEVDRLDHAVSSAANPSTFFWTSNIFFSTVICFRSLAVSVLSFFLSQYTSLRGIIAVPLAALFCFNIVIRLKFALSECVNFCIFLAVLVFWVVVWAVIVVWAVQVVE